MPKVWNYRVWSCSPERSPSSEVWMWQLDPVIVVASPQFLVLAEDRWDQTRNSFCEHCVYLLRDIQIQKGHQQPRVKYACVLPVCCGHLRGLPFRKGDGGQGCPPPWVGLQAHQPQQVLCATLPASRKTRLQLICWPEVYVTQRDQNTCNQ